MSLASSSAGSSSSVDVATSGAGSASGSATAGDVPTEGTDDAFPPFSTANATAASDAGGDAAAAAASGTTARGSRVRTSGEATGGGRAGAQAAADRGAADEEDGSDYVYEYQEDPLYPGYYDLFRVPGPPAPETVEATSATTVTAGDGSSAAAASESEQGDAASASAATAAADGTAAAVDFALLRAWLHAGDYGALLALLRQRNAISLADGCHALRRAGAYREAVRALATASAPRTLNGSAYLCNG